MQDSWKKKLHNKYSDLTELKSNESVDPPPKKVKVDSISKSTSNKPLYEQHVKHLQKCYNTSKYSSHHNTARRNWKLEEEMDNGGMSIC